jgi:fumarate reductase subunit C
MSNRFKPASNTYVRPMTGWWKRNPYHRRYMLREATALLITLYALNLLLGLFCEQQGEAAYNAWLGAMRSPLAWLFNLLVFVAVCYHSWTWFKVMPKTMPNLPVDEKLVPVFAMAGVAVISVIVLIIVGWMAR